MRILIVFLGMLICSAAQAATVKVATVNFAPILTDVAANRKAIVQLTEEAARNGAKIIVHTEMATSGYSFFSREQISRVAEQIPGPTTNDIAAVAAKYQVYVAFGMPEYDASLNSYFNSAVLVGPTGSVVGVYRKRNNLLEASYNSEEFGPLPVFDTAYGKVGIVICADMFYPQFPRAAAIAGVNILLAPANVGITTDFMKVLTFENDFAMVVANRFGKDAQGTNIDVFTQDTFTIGSPFPYDFGWDSRSVIMAADGRVLAEIDQDAVAIGYGELPIGEEQMFPVVRKPQMYSLIGQDTLESYTFTQFGMPVATKFVAAAVDPGPSRDPVGATLAALQQALDDAKTLESQLRLAVLPEAYFSLLTSGDLERLQNFATEHEVDVVVNIQEEGTPPITRFLTSDRKIYDYVGTHRLRNSPVKASDLSDNYWVIDRDYGRVALSQGIDMLVPETALVMAKMGVDVIAVSANDPSALLDTLWAVRSANYVHLVVSNKSGNEGIFLGGYKSMPSQSVGAGQVLREINTEDVRSKKWPRFFDYRSIVRRCSESNC